MGKNINDVVGQNIGEMYLPKCICAPHFFSFFFWPGLRNKNILIKDKQNYLKCFSATIPSLPVMRSSLVMSNNL